jgi:hypothetical protein
MALITRGKCPNVKKREETKIKASWHILGEK